MPVQYRYLNAVRQQVATALRPPGMGEMAQKQSLYTERVLTYLAVNDGDLPALAAAQIEACRELLPALKAALPDQPALVVQLDDALQATAEPARASAALQAILQPLLRQHDAQSQALVRRIGDLELTLQQGFAQALERESAPVTTAAHVDEGLSSQQKQHLTDVLRARFPDDAGVTIQRIKAIPGGFSKQTIFVDLADTRRLPSSVVLRVDKADSPVETTVADEFEIIEAMHRAGVQVPQPLLLETDKSVLGGAFIVVGRIDGTAAGDAFDVFDKRRVFGETLASELAKMHAVPIGAVSDRVPGAKIGARERMLGDIDTFEKKWRASGIPSITLELAYGWLRANIDHAESGRRCIVHRDIGCHNLLVKDARLVAILDWETALIGDPAQDIGYVLHTVTQVMPWEDFLIEYERAGGKRPSNPSIDFYRVWRHVWLMTMQCQARSAIEAGYTQDMGLIYNVLNLFQRLTLSLQTLLHEIDRA